MHAWCCSTAAKRNNLLDLRERHAESARLPNKRKQSQHVVWITPIPGLGSMRTRQNTARFVHPKRLAAETAALCHFSDQ